MRMRRKRHLEERMAECKDVLLAKEYLTANTRKAIEEKRSLLDYQQIFGNHNPVHVELGCGLGGFCIELAKRRPDVNVIAVERVSNVLLTAMENAKKENLPNLRFLNIPVECLQIFIPENSVERIYLNFSTPLPKAGYAKQRLTHPIFLSIYSKILQDGGEIWQKTDSMHFFEFSIESFSAMGYRLKDISLDLHHSDFKENIVTEYENNFASQGLPIYRLVAVKQNDLKREADSVKDAVPTRVLYGKGCVKKNAELFSSLGTRAFIVTGKSSAKNGALQDAQDALSSCGIPYTVFDRVEPNPTIACVREAIACLKAARADFIVAIGGGSPMDAAKAIATLAVQDRADEDIFKGGYEDIALPMAHIPTTAGTGSEVTPYSILTNDFDKTKTSISSRAMYPRYAFLDGSYTATLGRATTIHTAIDALSHAVEGMFTVKATPETDKIAKKAISLLFSEWKNLKEYALTEKDRDILLIASMLAGVVIAHTGTTAVHAMGYALTYHHGVAHGRANGILLGKMVELCQERLPEKTAEMLRAAGFSSAKDFTAAVNSLIGVKENIPREELLSYAEQAARSKKLVNVTYHPTYEDIERMYLESFDK